MSNIADKAKEYLSYQLSVIPTKADKTPAIGSWSPYQTTRMKPEEVDKLFTGSSIKGLAIICGAVSGNLEVIDVDTKYDITGSLRDELSSLIEDNLPEIFHSLVIARTVSGGYHIYYKCSQIEGNKKLANRPTTTQEKEQTYLANLGKGYTDKELKIGTPQETTPEKLAKITSDKDTVRVLIETRGKGGYVIAPPSPGYEYIQGGPDNIPAITPEQREILFSICKSFNELPEEEIKPKVKATPAITHTSTGLSPWEDYDNRGDVVALLENNGWREVFTIGERVYLLRPGETKTKYSGNFHTGKRTLKVYSTSTDFDIEKAYGPTEVFILLEGEGDKSKAYKKLLEKGYGEPYTGDNSGPIKVKKAQTQIEIGTKVVATTGGDLKIKTTPEEMVITSPGPEAQAEVLEAIAQGEEAGKRIYIREGDSPEIRSYEYQLQGILHKYGKLEEGKDRKLPAREIDNLLEEVVETATRIPEPMDRDLFTKLFTSIPEIQELGITEESLQATVERIQYNKAREEQTKELKRLLSRATDLQDKGEVGEALELLDNRTKEIKLTDKATEFNRLLIPVKENELRERQSNKPDSLLSGYTIKGEDLLLPSGAISVISAPTSHGKTTFLINLALNVARTNPDKETYFFSFEEDGDTVLMNTLNSYIGENISANNRKSIRSYFTTGSTNMISTGHREHFTDTKDKFFRELVDTRRLNILYSDYDTDTLIEAIRYLHKETRVGAVFIDYIQLLHLPVGKYKTYSRQEEVKQICIDLKNIAVETGLPIILGAQFNREVINHLRIHATTLGEAGDIERISSLIVGFWNNNFTPPFTKGDKELTEITRLGINTPPDSLYVKVLKNRGGRPGEEEMLDYNGNAGVIKNSLLSTPIKSNSIKVEF